jgi:hypothetical protein
VIVPCRESDPSPTGLANDDGEDASCGGQEHMDRTNRPRTDDESAWSISASWGKPHWVHPSDSAGQWAVRIADPLCPTPLRPPQGSLTSILCASAAMRAVMAPCRVRQTAGRTVRVEPDFYVRDMSLGPSS